VPTECPKIRELSTQTNVAATRVWKEYLSNITLYLLFADKQNKSVKKL
jgi:hypothetical protein